MIMTKIAKDKTVLFKMHQILNVMTNIYIYHIVILCCNIYIYIYINTNDSYLESLNEMKRKLDEISNYITNSSQSQLRKRKRKKKAPVFLTGMSQEMVIHVPASLTLIKIQKKFIGQLLINY